MAVLNTTNSIVDYLTSVNQPTSYSYRTSLYQKSGLADRLGAYTGSSSQNLALIKSLQSTSEPIPTSSTSNPLPNTFGQTPTFASPLNFKMGGISTPSFTPTAPKPAAPAYTPQFNLQNLPLIGSVGGQTSQNSPITGQPVATPTNLYGYGGSPTATPNSTAPIPTATPAPAPTSPATATAAPASRTISAPITSGATTGGGAPGGAAPVSSGGGGTGGAFATGSPSSASYALANLPSVPSAEDIFNQLMNSPKYGLAENRETVAEIFAQATAAAEKQAAVIKAAQDTKKFEDLLGQRGLFFSGQRIDGVMAIANGLAASQLGTDRKLAEALISANLDLRDKILAQTADLIKSAADKNTDAIKQLNAAGYAVIGNKLVPTLEAMKYMDDKEKNAFTQQMQLDSFQQRLNEFDALQAQRETSNKINQEKLQISWQNAQTSQERNSLLNQMRQISLLQKTAVSPGQIVNAATGLPVALTDAQVQRFGGYDNYINNFVPAIRDLLSHVTTGGAKGAYMKYVQDKPALQYTLSNEENAFLSKLAEMNNTLIYLLSGKQINPEEFKRLQDQLPLPTLTNDQNTIRLNQFEADMNSIYARQLQLSGLAIANNTTIDFGTLNSMFTNEDLGLGNILFEDTTDSGLDYQVIQ